jgi:hypothetical protein
MDCFLVKLDTLSSPVINRIITGTAQRWLLAKDNFPENK